MSQSEDDTAELCFNWLSAELACKMRYLRSLPIGCFKRARLLLSHTSSRNSWVDCLFTFRPSGRNWTLKLKIGNRFQNSIRVFSFFGGKCLRQHISRSPRRKSSLAVKLAMKTGRESRRREGGHRRLGEVRWSGSRSLQTEPCARNSNGIFLSPSFWASTSSQHTKTNGTASANVTATCPLFFLLSRLEERKNVGV